MAMKYVFQNLVFEGGGVKGIAYVGALEELENRGIMKNIQRVGGTSAGAINALLIGLGYSLDEMKKVLFSLNFKKFLDDDWGVVRDTKRLVKEYGWYKGDFFHEWVGKHVEDKAGNADATFKELNEKGFLDMYFCGVNLSTHYGEVFSFEHTPRLRVADAVRISMSIPLFFASVKSARGDCYVDGGLLNNFPIKIFDRVKYVENKEHARKTDYFDKENRKLKRLHPKSSPYVYNKETLGFRLDSGQEIAVFRDGAQPQRRRINDFLDYSWALIETILESQGNQHLHSDDWHRTVYIDTLGVRTTDFGLSRKKKEALIESGRKNTMEYFKWFDDLKKDPAVNHPEMK